MPEHSDNRKLNTSKLYPLFIILIIFLNIITDQSINTIILESIQPLDINYSGWLTNGFMILSIPGSLLLAGWSDFHCRRKTIILTLIFAFISYIFIATYNLFGIKGFGISSLAIKALLGSVTPICFATLADIISRRRFRNVLALAIVAYSIGIWTPIYFKSLLEAGSGFLLIFAFFVTLPILGTFLFVKDEKFDNVKFYKNPANLKSFFTFFKKDTKLIILFLMSPIVAPALICFFFGEISYYQFLLRGELLSNANFYVSQTLFIAIGYYIGTLILLTLGWLNFKDMTCIKLGLIISILSSAIILLEHYLQITNPIHTNIFISLFSIGFSLVTPSLFASLSKISKVEEQGKIYGSLDSTDTLATLSSALIIKRTKFSPIYLILFFTFLIFSISCIFFLRFLKKYKQITQSQNS